MIMATVAYLLGAGASAQCIPVVNGMEEDILKLTEEIGSRFSVSEEDIMGYRRILHSDVLEKVQNVLKDLSLVCKKHYSIDTYAKKLFITDAVKFKQLKLDLSLYFTLRQMVTGPDKRYDNFFSSILTAQKKLPKKIKIVSWNYDFQIEKSYLEFDIGSDIKQARELLGMNSPKDWASQNVYANKFNIIKMNGSAIIKTDDHHGYLFEGLLKENTTDIEQIVQRYFSIIESKKEYECELKFAWENEHYETLFAAAKADLASIEVLVVIGYSFPFFNRDVDKKLFDCMPILDKIYIQDIIPENIKETMIEFVELDRNFPNEIDIILKRNIDQFVFPKELEVTERTLKDL
jgi:hypothetical protein